MSVEEKSLKIKDEVEIIITSQKIVIASYNNVTLKGKDRLITAYKIIPILKRGATLKEIINSLPNYDPSSVKDLIQQLKNNGLISWNKKKRSSPKILNSSLYSKLTNSNRIIKELVINSKIANSYQLPFFLVSSKYKSHNHLQKNENENWSTGKDQDLEKAIIKSITESIERYSNGHYNLKKLTYGSIKELGKKIVNPQELVAYSKKQYTKNFPYSPLDINKKYYWNKGIDLFHNKEKLLLADCIYYPFLKNESKRKLYTGATSSGTAVHSSIKKATEKAINELIEREAFMITWLNKIPMPIVRKSCLPTHITKRINYLNNLGFQTNIIDITLDLLPVFLTVITSKRNGLAFFTGASCDQNPEKAIQKALDEAEALLYFGIKYPFSLINKKEVKSPLDHLRYYRDISNAKIVRFFTKGNKYTSVRKLVKKSSVDIIHNYFDSLISMNLTPNFVKKLYNLSVVKVFIPGMVPISFGHKQEPLNMERIKTIPESLNLVNKKELDNINIDNPHPFA